MDNSAIPMILTCAACGDRHIDEGEFATKLHHTHSCQSCGHTWRPAIVPTVGVRFLPGFKNTQGDVINLVIAERGRQDAEWGGPRHDDEHGPEYWREYLALHVDKLGETITGEGYEELDDKDGYRDRLIKIAALAVAAGESMLRRKAIVDHLASPYELAESEKRAAAREKAHEFDEDAARAFGPPRDGD